MYKANFFDLDGTLTSHGEGITKSVQYATGKRSETRRRPEKLKVFVDRRLMETVHE